MLLRARKQQVTSDSSNQGRVGRTTSANPCKRFAFLKNQFRMIRLLPLQAHAKAGSDKLSELLRRALS
jgi:hypothetical protein